MINPKFLGILAIMGILLIILFPHTIYNGITEPFKDNSKLNKVTELLKQNPDMINNIINNPEISKTLMKENLTKVIIKETIYITVTVTPTPDGKTYFAGEYQNGTRLLYRPYTFMRYNATGYKDLSVTTRVYDYKIFNKLHIFNPTEYSYNLVYPRSENKFLFIFVNSYLNDITGDDTRFWAIDKNMIVVNINGIRYTASNYPEQLRIKELEETFCYDESIRVESFGQKRLYSSSSEYRQTAGEFSSQIGWMKGGISNSFDGYILYEIPENTKDDDIKVMINFYSFGDANWILKTS